ncbi:MAG TPA: DUF2461 domain-containing protein [Chitinophagaceae bacterium]|nr:DUF2461 domain-containing protein [Chitinophagaceae bacterium]
MLSLSTLKFLKDLKKNNNKPWFDLNRKRYEDAKMDFAVFVQQVIDKQGKNDPSIKNLTAKECLFRINRDIRFAKDKSPYKTNFGASINKGGKKAFGSAGYYFHLEPGGSFTGGGLYGPIPEELKKTRQEIDYNFPDLKKILAAKKFRSVYKDLDKTAEFMLTRIPKGYPADHPASEYLRLKSYIAMISLKDTDLTSKDLVKKTVAAFEALQPVIEFFNEALGV